MKSRNSNVGRKRSLFQILLAVAIAGICLCACGGMEEDVASPGVEMREGAFSVGLTMRDLISTALPSEQIPEEMNRIWMGLFDADGNLKKAFIYGNGLTLTNGKVNLNLTRDLVSSGDILTVVKLPGDVMDLGISTLTDLRNVGFSSSDIQGSDSEALYGEKTLTTDDCSIGNILELNLMRPFAKIEISDETEDENARIESIVMENCPSSGKLGDALINEYTESYSERSIGSTQQTFQSDGNGNFHLFVPYVSFSTNEAESDERALTLTLKNGKTKRIWITKYDGGEPVPVEATDKEWQALLPGYRYPFTYKGKNEDDNPQIKDKIRIRWASDLRFGKFAGTTLSLGENGKLKGTKIPNSKYIEYEYYIGKDIPDKIPYYILNEQGEKLSIVGDLLSDVLISSIVNSNDTDYTLFKLTGETGLDSMDCILRFYCRDIDDGFYKGELKLLAFLGNDHFKKLDPIEFKVDQRGYKFVDIELAGGSKFQDLWDLRISLINSSEEFDIMDYFWEFEDQREYNASGINVGPDTFREEHDGKIYQCFYLN